MGEKERRSQLHVDIDEYIQQRRQVSPLDYLPKLEFTHMETYEHKIHKPSVWSRVKDWFHTEKEEPKGELPPLEEEPPMVQAGEPEPMLDEERGSLLKRLLALFIKEHEIMQEVPEMPIEKVDEAKNDLKDLAKLFLKTLERLPEAELTEFKEAPEFVKFKDILRKHQVIK